MPNTLVVFYCERDASVPVRDWLEQLLAHDRRAFASCAAAIQRLAELGHELRRPQADYLRDGIYELRVKRGRVNYRLLYFFHGQNDCHLGARIDKRGPGAGHRNRARHATKAVV